MSELNPSTAITSNLKNSMDSFKVPGLKIESATGQEETEWINVNASTQLGYYKTIPELKKAIDLYAIWAIGQGYDLISSTDAVIIDHITGRGNQNFHQILWNMLVCKKIYGDAFCEIVRDPKSGILLNLKCLDNNAVKIIYNSEGMIIRYEQINKINKKQTLVKWDPQEIFHLANDLIADEMHGTSVIDACKFVIDARNEAMSDWKTVLHRNINPLKIVYVDSDDPVKLEQQKTLWEKMTKDKEVIFVPKDSSKVEIPTVVLQPPFETIKYYENFFYQAVGVPKVITGGSQEFTEAGSKISYLTFEQTYNWDQVNLEQDIWNQLSIMIKFRKPASLKNELVSDNQKDGTQNLQGGGFQPSDVTAGAGA